MSTFPRSPLPKTTRAPLELDTQTFHILNRHLLVPRVIPRQLRIPALVPSQLSHPSSSASSSSSGKTAEPLVNSIRELWTLERARRLSLGLPPTPPMPSDPVSSQSSNKRGTGGELAWEASPRHIKEFEARLERERGKGRGTLEKILFHEGDGDIGGGGGRENWERMAWTSFESTEMLWERRWWFFGSKAEGAEGPAAGLKAKSKEEPGIGDADTAAPQTSEKAKGKRKPRTPPASQFLSPDSDEEDSDEALNPVRRKSSAETAPRVNHQFLASQAMTTALEREAEFDSDEDAPTKPPRTSPSRNGAESTKRKGSLTPTKSDPYSTRDPHESPSRRAAHKNPFNQPFSPSKLSTSTRAASFTVPDKLPSVISLVQSSRPTKVDKLDDSSGSSQNQHDVPSSSLDLEDDQRVVKRQRVVFQSDTDSSQEAPFFTPNAKVKTNTSNEFSSSGSSGSGFAGLGLTSTWSILSRTCFIRDEVG